jgi:cysteine desulfurase
MNRHHHYRQRTDSLLLSFVCFTLSVATSVAFLSLWQKKKRKDDEILYLDYNGTTPVDPVVLEAMMPFLQEHFGNPGSTHALGDAPRQAINHARRQCLTHLLGGCAEIPLSACLFTACGTEADNLAIHLAIQMWSNKQRRRRDGEAKEEEEDGDEGLLLPHIVTTNIEHPAVDGFLSVQVMEGRCTVTRVAVQSDGRVAADDMIAAIQSNT